MSLADRIVKVESGGNPNARNPRSSASGLGQFIDRTWLEMLAKHRPDLQGSREQLLALKNDPELSKAMTDAYAADNSGLLAKSGLPVTPGTQYLAHFAGPQGAVGLLSADPSMPAGSVLGESAMRANPFLQGMTAGDVAAWAEKKMGGAVPQATPQTPQQAPMSIGANAPQPSAPMSISPDVAQAAAPFSFGAMPQQSPMQSFRGTLMASQKSAEPEQPPDLPMPLKPKLKSSRPAQRGGFFNARGYA